MTFLILTAAVADQVRGPAGAGAALDPRPLTGGRFVLPVAVLDDPAHADRRALLDGVPRGDLAEIVGLLPVDEAD